MLCIKPNRAGIIRQILSTAFLGCQSLRHRHLIKRGKKWGISESQYTSQYIHYTFVKKVQLILIDSSLALKHSHGSITTIYSIKARESS